MYPDNLSFLLIAPSRGHELKPICPQNEQTLREIAPSRGHELKHAGRIIERHRHKIAPSRGHELKQRSL